MTTFTIQDLTPAQQEAVKQHEAMLSAYSIVNNRSINNVPTVTKEEFMEHGMNNPISASSIEYATQPSGENPHNIGDIINTICTQLQLLATVIKQQPNTTPPEGNPPSLQETIELTLQQADWFKGMVRETIVDEVSLEDVVKDIVKEEVESAVDNYFRNEFDPTHHFDFGDAVCSEVSDQLDDVVQEQLEEVVAEKLKSIRVVFD